MSNRVVKYIRDELALHVELNKTAALDAAMEGKDVEPVHVRSVWDSVAPSMDVKLDISSIVQIDTNVGLVEIKRGEADEKVSCHGETRQA